MGGLPLRLPAWKGALGAFLYASGMSAVTHVLHALRRPGVSQVISVGHLYSDTVDLLRFAPRRQGEAENIFIGVHEVSALESLINDQTVAVLTETITNPLNDVPDLPASPGSRGRAASLWSSTTRWPRR